MSTENKNFVVLHASDFKSKAMAAYLLWIHRKLMGIPRDNIMLHQINIPNAYELPFTEETITDQTYYFVGCPMHPAFDKKDVTKFFFRTPADVYNTFSTISKQAKHAYPEILSKLFRQDMPLYCLTDTQYEEFHPFIEDAKFNSESHWDVIRTNASKRIQHLDEGEELPSPQENMVRTVRIISEEIDAYLSAHPEEEVMARISVYPWYSKHLALKDTTDEHQKMLIGNSLFTMLFTVATDVWSCDAKQAQLEKFRTQFNAGASIYNTDVDHAQFWFTLFDESQETVAMKDLQGKEHPLNTEEKDNTPIKFKEDFPLEMYKAVNIREAAHFVDPFNPETNTPISEYLLVKDVTVRVRTATFEEQVLLPNLDKVFLRSPYAIDENTRTVDFTCPIQWDSTTYPGENSLHDIVIDGIVHITGTVNLSNGALILSGCFESTANKKTIDEVHQEDCTCGCHTDQPEVVITPTTFRLEGYWANAIHREVTTPKCTDTDSFTNQIFQAGCAILEYLEMKERYISRTCSFPVQITIDDRVLTLLALNTPPSRAEIMKAVENPVYDGYLMFCQLNKERFLLDIDLYVPAMEMGDPTATNYTERMESYLNQLAVPNTLNVRVSPSPDRKFDRFTGTLITYRGSWNALLNASDIDKQGVEVPTA